MDPQSETLRMTIRLVHLSHYDGDLDRRHKDVTY